VRLEADQARDACATLVAAFDTDPTWSWMFEAAGDREFALTGVIASLVAGGYVNNSAWTTPGCESVAIWVPPGGQELTPELEVELEALVAAESPLFAQRLTSTFDVFTTARMKSPPHHYLSMFGTFPSLQGEGFGAHLLRECLAETDAAGIPTYLESSNQSNDPMYEHFGYTVIGPLDVPEGCPPVNAMWREAR
jgi:GNAT superfamily N-acetyltransferase